MEKKVLLIYIHIYINICTHTQTHKLTHHAEQAAVGEDVGGAYKLVW